MCFWSPAPPTPTSKIFFLSLRDLGPPFSPLPPFLLFIALSFLSGFDKERYRKLFFPLRLQTRSFIQPNLPGFPLAHRVDTSLLHQPVAPAIRPSSSVYLLFCSPKDQPIFLSRHSSKQTEPPYFQLTPLSVCPSLLLFLQFSVVIFEYFRTPRTPPHFILIGFLLFQVISMWFGILGLHHQPFIFPPFNCFSFRVEGKRCFTGSAVRLNPMWFLSPVLFAPELSPRFVFGTSVMLKEIPLLGGQ